MGESIQTGFQAALTNSGSQAVVVEWCVGVQPVRARVDVQAEHFADVRPLHQQLLPRNQVGQQHQLSVVQAEEIGVAPPIERRIRSWMFNSDGSFGEGSWFKDGANWMSRMSLTMADGSVASGTQVFMRTDNDTYQVESIGREIDGESMPSAGTVTVVRAVEQAAANSEAKTRLAQIRAQLGLAPAATDAPAATEPAAAPEAAPGEAGSA